MSFVHRHAPAAVPLPDDYCFLVQGDRVLARVSDAGLVVFATVEVVAGLYASSALLHVGKLSGQSCWACMEPRAEVDAPTSWEWHETRALLSAFTPAQAQALSCARQLLYWDRRHRCCGACGTPTEVLKTERARRCPRCHEIYFPVASSAMIVAVTRGDELLLAHNRNFRPGMFSLLAGFVDPGETLEQAVVREVREEVGIEIGDLRYVASQPWSFPNSLMIGFTARYVAGELSVDGKEIEQANWFRRGALPDIPRHGTVARLMIDRWVAGG